MQTLLERFSPVRSPEGEGNAGGQPPAGAAASGDGAAAAESGAAGPGAASAADPYRPQGLPDTMYGTNDRETMDKMATALAGYRTRDSERGVPDTADAYKAFDFGKMDAGIKPHMERLATDPVFKAVSDRALALGAPVQLVQELASTMYGEGVKSGLFEGFIDEKAERAQLLPESAKSLPQAAQDAAIDARLQANEDFVTLMAKPGADGRALLDAKDAEHVKLMLMDSAAGNRFLEAFRSIATGADKPGPIAGHGGAPGGAATTREALRAKMAALPPPGHPKYNRADHDALDEEFKRAFPG